MDGGKGDEEGQGGDHPQLHPHGTEEVGHGLQLGLEGGAQWLSFEFGTLIQRVFSTRFFTDSVTHVKTF